MSCRDGPGGGQVGYVLSPDLAGLEWVRPTRVVLAARKPAVQLGDEEHAVAVLRAERAGAHLAEGRRLLPARVTLVPGALPSA